MTKNIIKLATVCKKFKIEFQNSSKKTRYNLIKPLKFQKNFYKIVLNQKKTAVKILQTKTGQIIHQIKSQFSQN